jgi:hypothetical protein
MVGSPSMAPTALRNLPRLGRDDINKGSRSGTRQSIGRVISSPHLVDRT